MASPWMERLLSQGAGPPPDPLEEEREEEEERSPWLERVFSQAASPEPRERRDEVLTREDIFAPPEEPPEEAEPEGEGFLDRLRETSGEQYEQLLRSPPIAGARHLARGAAQVGQGLLGAEKLLGETAAGLAGKVGLETVERGLEQEVAKADTVSQALQTFSEALEVEPERGRGYVDQIQESPERTPEVVFQAVMENIPQLAGSGLAMAKLGANGGLAWMWAQEGGHEYEALTAQGADQETAAAGAATVGAINAALERVPVTRLLRGIKDPGLGKSLLRSAGRQAALEGGTEGAQEFVSNVTEAITTGEPMDPVRIAEAAGAGALLGGLAGAATGPMPGDRSNTQLPAREESRVLPGQQEPAPSPEVAEVQAPETPSHDGQAGESPEAISRVARGERYFRVTPGGETLPIPNTVDMRPNPGEAKVRVSRDGVLDIEEGGKGTMAQRAAISRLGDGTARELAETLRPTEEVEPQTFELDAGEGLPSEVPETQEMALPEAREIRPPQRVRRLEGAQPRTRWGQEVVQKIESDPEGRKYGVRTIVDGLVEQVGAELRIGKEQTRRKNPAHYARTPHMIRARATAMPWMTHEVGHAISRRLGQVSSKVNQEVEQDLVALTEREGSMASAKTAEEGWAEWVRLYVTDPTNMKDIPATAAIESSLARSAPETLAHLQDAAIAYDAHMGREAFATWRSHSKARPKKQPLATRIREMAWAAAFKGAARRAGIDYLERNVWRAGKRAEGDRKTVNQKIRRFFESVPGTPGNLRAAYQSVLRVPREVDRAIVGPEAKGARKGLRVLFTGDRSPWSDLRFQLESTLPAIALDDAAAAERLRRKIGRIENIPHRHHGEYAYLTETTPQEVIERLSEQWDDFEAWAQARVALDRHQKKGHDYPGRTAGDPTPDELADIVARGEENAEWVQAFEGLETYANALLAVSVEAGLVKPSEAARMLATYDHYLPLLPKIEREMEYGGAGAETPDAGYRRAYGSESAYRPLMEALSTRTRQVLQAYYQNRMARSALSLIDQAQRSDLPEESKITLARVATPLRRDNRIAARIEEGDIRGATREIAEDINARLEEEAGRKLSDEELYSPEDIELELVGTALWRSESPRALRVIAPMVDGHRRFYQVEDPILWEFFRSGSDPHESIRLLERVGVGMRRAWKRIVTQNIAFAVRNLARDATTAMFFGDGPESYATGYYAAGGMIRKLTGRIPGEVASGELLSRSFETTESPAHRARISGFTQMLEEGIVIDGWNKLSLAEKLAEAPGVAMSLALKPVEVALYATGQRYAAQFAEEATRIQAAAQALARGGTTEEAQAAYDYVSGNFADHPGSADIASLYRIPGFLNPGVQITYEIGNRLTHPDPKVRRRHWIKAIPVTATTTALAWALNRLITPDEKEEEMAERADEDKLAYAVIGGHMRIPFDYGPLGAVQSWTWNSLDTMAGQGPKSGVRMAGEILRRAKDLPIGGPMSFLPPQLLAIEENRANYVWYWGDEIEPYWMEWIPRPEDRAFWSTPRVYQLMSRWMGNAGVEAGPLKIQHFVRAGMAYQLDETLAFIDGLSRGTVQPGEVHRWPFVGRLLQKPPKGWYSQSVRSISELDKEYQQARKELEEVESSGDYTSEEIRSLENQLDSLATFHAGMKDMRRYNEAIGDARKEGDLEEARRLTDEMTIEAQRIVEQAATEFR